MYIHVLCAMTSFVLFLHDIVCCTNSLDLVIKLPPLPPPPPPSPPPPSPSPPLPPHSRCPRTTLVTPATCRATKQLLLLQHPWDTTPRPLTLVGWAGSCHVTTPLSGCILRRQSLEGCGAPRTSLLLSPRTTHSSSSSSSSSSKVCSVFFRTILTLRMI